MSLWQDVQRRGQASPLLQRWQQLADRDRQALRLLGLALLLALLYVMLWQPVQRQLQESRTWHAQQQELWHYLQANAEQARQRPAQAVVPVEASQLQGLVTRTAQQAGLRLERFDSDSQGVQVSLVEADFASLLRWLQQLQGQGVICREASLTRLGHGRVQARLLLAAG